MNNTTWRIVRDQVVAHLKGKAVTLALKKILGSAALGGFKTWVIKYIVENLFEEVAEPFIEWSIRKGFLGIDKAKGAIQFKKIEKAKDENNESDYINTIGNV